MSTDATAPVLTRKRAKEAAAEPSTEAATLQEILAEMRRMREEQACGKEEQTRMQKELAELRQRDEELRMPRTNQLSPSQIRAVDFRESGDAGGRVPACVSGDAGRAEADRVPACVGADVERVPSGVSGDVGRVPVCESGVAGHVPICGGGVAGRADLRRVPADANGGRAEIGTKFKPDTYDGTVPLREFLLQFDLVARANRWDDSCKAVALASSLRGKARSVLETVQDLESLEYEELKSKLELRFGETHSAQSSYTRFANRRQRFGEDFAALGAELEKLARYAYPECSFAVREKIACAQFITALSDDFIRRTLRLEGVSSLEAAIERAKAVWEVSRGGREGGNPHFCRPFSGTGEENLSGAETKGAPSNVSVNEAKGGGDLCG